MKSVNEAEATVEDAKGIETLIRKLDDRIEDTKSDLKDLKDEREQAVMSLRRLFSKAENDLDRPLLPEGDEDES